MEPWDTHLRMPSRVLFLTPAIRAVSSTMQLNILRWGGSGARAATSGFVARGGKVLRRMVSSALLERWCFGAVEVVVKVGWAPWASWALVEAAVWGSRLGS
jgi:hypothetical protein